MPLGPARVRLSNGRMNLVGGHVKELRKNLRLTQDQLCARIADHTGGKWGPTWRDIYRIEAGTRIVSDIELIALAAALETTIIFLLLGDTEDIPGQELAMQIIMTSKDT